MDRFDELNRLPFELAYLALLTSYRVKPLSRWESSIGPREIGVLAGLGLEIAEINRYTLLGRRAPRVVFSKSPRYLNGYGRLFDGRRLGRSRTDTKLEGWFFGYPSCCVEQFVKRPYAPNGLAGEDQRILFHWACPDCAATDSLLRDYRRVHAECVRIMGREPEWNALAGKRRMHGSSFRRALPWAASVAALALLSGLQGVSATDPHVLPAPDDDDGDGLTYAEERLVGRCPTLYDTDANMVLDGIDVAATLHAMITGLPTSPVPDLPYAIPMLMLGLEECAICGEMVNMGFYLVVHPLRGIEVGVPVIALHYMEHGSIGYDGDVHGVGRVDIEGLKRVLFPSNPAHIYSRLSEFDIDEDQLYDEEEPLLGTDPADPDTDDDSLGDAPQVAERLLSAISTLPREERPDGPYIVDYVERGIETCWMCGGEMDMGFLEIVNPLEEMSFRINYMTLHYMAHGGFSALSDVHGLVNTLPTVIDVMLNGTGGAHRIPVPGDSDSDGLSDGEETALGLNPHNPDSDGDGVTDGPDLALYLYDYIGKLPEHYPNDPIPTHHVYVVNWKMLGVIPCLICGEACNMGYMEIIDPVAEKSTTLSYYGYHFMEQGSFSTDRGRIDVEALVDVLGVIVTGGEVPGPERALLSNAPNPFAGSTKIDLYMPSTVDITVAVFDAAGRKVCDIYAGEAPAGRSEFLWDGRDAAGRELVTGVYFCKIQFGSMSISKKMLKIR